MDAEGAAGEGWAAALPALVQREGLGLVGDDASLMLVFIRMGTPRLCSQTFCFTTTAPQSTPSPLARRLGLR